jgi:hypothetical protein
MKNTTGTIKVSDWRNCYSEGWGKELDPSAYSHPAKFSKLLIMRIYQHALAQGYIEPGSHVVDPFGGVALGARYALQYGLHWTGVELEERFVTLGNANIDLWNGRYDRYFAEKGKVWGTARLLQGDSRNLAAIVQRAGMCVSSPPYTGSALGNDAGCVRLDSKEDERRQREGAFRRTGYGASGGQLGSMPEGQFTAAISSPPYADAVSGNGEGPGARHDPIYHNGDNAFKVSSAAEYGRTVGNLGNLNGNGGFAAAISSPPFMTSGTGADKESNDRQVITSGVPSHRNGAIIGSTDYGDTAGQLGQDQGETFWTAARLIVEQVHTVLRPGGYSIWVCKRFVRNKKIVEFSEQWAQLCAAVGFERVEWIRAWLVEENGTQLGIFGEDKSRNIKRASFFRRLYEKKYPENSIEWEDVLILQKPSGVVK